MSVRSLLAAALLALPVAARAGDVGASAVFPGGPRVSFLAAPNPGGVVYETGESAAIADTWDTVLFQGESPDSGIVFEAARKLPNGQWSAWQSAPVKRFPGGRFWGKAVFAANAPGSVRLRALDGGVASTHEVKIYSVEVFVSASRESAVAPVQADAADAPRPAVHDRSEWHAVPPHEAYIPHAPYRLTLHHSDTKQSYTLADTLQEVKFIQDFHMNGRGWNDIAYHFLIDAAGNIVEGRPEGVVGSHVQNQNTGNIGIVMLGTYHPPKNDPVTKEQLDAFVRVASYVIDKYGIDRETLKGHRDYKSTDCPGDELYALLPQLKARLPKKGASVAGKDAALKILRPLTLRLPKFN